MTKPVVTAVGRMLKPKHGEPQVWRQIKVQADGTAAVIQRHFQSLRLDLMAEAKAFMDEYADDFRQLAQS